MDRQIDNASIADRDLILTVDKNGQTHLFPTVYARRMSFSKDRPSSAKPAFPVAVAVTICSRVIDWRQGSSCNRRLQQLAGVRQPNRAGQRQPSRWGYDPGWRTGGAT